MQICTEMASPVYETLSWDASSPSSELGHTGACSMHEGGVLDSLPIYQHHHLESKPSTKRSYTSSFDDDDSPQPSKPKRLRTDSIASTSTPASPISPTSPSSSSPSATIIRCYDHGCNGAPFSCRENYRRHLREREGLGEVECLFCFAKFSRKSNRDAHVRKGRCRVLKGWAENPWGVAGVGNGPVPVHAVVERGVGGGRGRDEAALWSPIEWGCGEGLEWEENGGGCFG